MKLYLGTPGWGWTMWGIGYGSTWFIGFTMKRKRKSRQKIKFLRPNKVERMVPVSELPEAQT